MLRSALKTMQYLSSIPTVPHPRQWLIKSYWKVAWAILALGAPVLLVWGSTIDLIAAGIFAGLNLVCWGVARKRPELAVGLHLLAIFPYWTWYVSMPEGVPRMMTDSPSGYVAMLLFPTMTLVAAWGIPGVVASFLLGLGSLVYIWMAPQPVIVGGFLFAVGIVVGLVFHQLVRRLESANGRLAHMAYHDALTGLPNRRVLQSEARRALTRAREDGKSAALLYLDLDRFKAINDSMGHQAGDDVLRKLARRLEVVAGDSRLLVRLGGDEFALFIGALDEPNDAIAMAERMLTSIEQEIVVDGQSVHLTGSIGIAQFPSDAEDLGELMRSADIAMYRAKAEGSGYKRYRPEHVIYTRDRLVLERDLHTALAEAGLAIYFQPVLDLTTERVIGAEALVRWPHEDRGLIQPAELIPLAEDTGLITNVDLWVLEHAVIQLVDWIRHGYDGWIATNLSATTLGEPTLLDRIGAILDAHPLKPGRLVLEVTESTAMRDPGLTAGLLHKLRARGVAVAIDDFGMGHSSLSYLKSFPVDHLKIDRLFVQGIGRDSRDEHLIEGVLQLAQNLGLTVLAEGVETRQQLEWLAGCGCHYGQGFYIGRPAPAAEVAPSFGETTDDAPPTASTG